jgi:prepilin-type N-terminal cleavage/methylation domain-containing protein
MKRQKGFSLIELLLVVSIISLLTSIVMSALDASRKKARDAARLEQAQTIRTALELYFSDNGSYPPVSADSGCEAGYDCSHLGGTFINGLSPFLAGDIKDPLNTSNYHYLYTRNTSGGGPGCPSGRYKYILAIKAFEEGSGAHFTPDFCGLSSGSPNFHWVTGGLE